MFAIKRFFSGVNPHVALEVRSLFGGVITVCASERLLTTMNQHMAFQFARPIACVVALVATVGLLSIIQGLLGNFYKVICLHFHTFLQRSDIVRGCRITEGKITLLIGKSYESESFVVQNCWGCLGGSHQARRSPQVM